MHLDVIGSSHDIMLTEHFRYQTVASVNVYLRENIALICCGCNLAGNCFQKQDKGHRQRTLEFFPFYSLKITLVGCN